MLGGRRDRDTGWPPSSANRPWAKEAGQASGSLAAVGIPRELGILSCSQRLGAQCMDYNYCVLLCMCCVPVLCCSYPYIRKCALDVGDYGEHSGQEAGTY